MTNRYFFVYNFNGEIYETNEAFDSTYRAKMRECLENGEPVSRQMIDNLTGRIYNQYYSKAGCVWLDEM